MSGYWTFKNYVDDGGQNDILAWLNTLPPRVKRKINVRIERMELEPRLQMPDVRVLKGPCAGLIELRVEYDKVQYRPLCCYGPGRGEVTILFGAVEKGGRFEPLSACSTALMRKTRIAEKGRVCDHDFS